jgi:hypothetical protein
MQERQQEKRKQIRNKCKGAGKEIDRREIKIYV